MMQGLTTKQSANSSCHNAMFEKIVCIRPTWSFEPPIPGVEYTEFSIYDRWGYAGYVLVPVNDPPHVRAHVLYGMGLFQPVQNVPSLSRIFS